LSAETIASTQIAVFGATAHAWGSGPVGMFEAGLGAADAVAVTPRRRTDASSITRRTGAMR
jgi:hypothetical protein